MDFLTIVTNDPLERVRERADRARAAYEERRQDLTLRLLCRKITPEQALAELHAMSAARLIEIDEIYAGLE